LPFIVDKSKILVDPTGTQTDTFIMESKLTLFFSLLTAAIFGIGCASTGNTTVIKTAPEFLNEGLVAHYPFNGDAKDVSGNNNHGKITGAIPTEDRLGVSKGALFFDADLDYIEIPHSESLSFKEEGFTIGVWLRYPHQKKTDGRNRAASQATGSLFGKVDPNDPESRQKGYPGVAFYAKTYASKSMRTISLRLTGKDEEHLGYVNSNLHDDSWRHFVFHKRGNTLSIYVNSVRVASREVSILNTYRNEAMIVIGANHANREGQNYRGRMDELRVYNRALSPKEIKGLFDYEKN